MHIYRLNRTRRTSRGGWWDKWDDTALKTQDSNVEPWRSEAEHATPRSRSRRLPTLFYLYDWAGKKHFVSLKLEGQSEAQIRDLRLSKQAALSTAPGPPPCWEVTSYPANTKRTNVDLMLGQRRRRWPSIKSTLVQRLVFSLGIDFYLRVLFHPRLIITQRARCRWSCLVIVSAGWPCIVIWWWSKISWRFIRDPTRYAVYPAINHRSPVIDSAMANNSNCLLEK